jgi:hypothetical protein
MTPKRKYGRARTMGVEMKTDEIVRNPKRQYRYFTDFILQIGISSTDSQTSTDRLQRGELGPSKK